MVVAPGVLALTVADDPVVPALPTEVRVRREVICVDVGAGADQMHQLVHRLLRHVLRHREDGPAAPLRMATMGGLSFYQVLLPLSFNPRLLGLLETHLALFRPAGMICTSRPSPLLRTASPETSSSRRAS